LPPDQIVLFDCLEEYFSSPPKLYKLIVEEKPQPKVDIRETDDQKPQVTLSFSLTGHFELDYEFAKQNNISVDNLPKSILVHFGTGPDSLNAPNSGIGESETEQK
jgi:hypothetical protein